MSVLPAVLPRLQGAWLTLFRAIWCVAFAVTLFSAVGATLLEMRPNSDAAPGWRTLTERTYPYGIGIFPPAGSASASWRMTRLFSAEARASGLEDRAEVLAINNVAVTGSTEPGTIAMALRPGEGARSTLRVRGVDGVEREVTLTAHASNVAHWFNG